MRWEFHGDAPIHAQVTERIERMIVSGALKPGERLPLVRTFALEAGVNPNTMQKALTELERGGLIYSQRTSGHFVTNDPQTIAAVREGLAAKIIRQYLRGMTELGCSPEEAEKLLRRQLTEGGEEHANSDL